jgi:hypothetical protein
VANFNKLRILFLFQGSMTDEHLDGFLQSSGYSSIIAFSRGTLRSRINEASQPLYSGIWNACKEALRHHNTPQEMEKAATTLDMLVNIVDEGHLPLSFRRKVENVASGAIIVPDPSLRDIPFFSSAIPMSGIVIKKTSIPEAQQTFYDSEHAKFLRNRGIGNFNLATVFPPFVYAQRGYAITMSQYIPGIEGDEAARILSAFASLGDRVAYNLRAAVIRQTIDDVLFWQLHFPVTSPMEKLSDIGIRYRRNFRDGLDIARNFTHSEHPVTNDMNIAGTEIDTVDIALMSLFHHHLPLEKRMVRIRDSVLSNCKLRFDDRKYANDEEKLETLKSMFAPGGVISPSRLEDTLYHFDTAGGKYGLPLEDIFQILDSLNLNLSPEERHSWLSIFNNVPPVEKWFTGAYRSIRNRGLVIGTYAVRNEQNYLKGETTLERRDALRRDYEKKAKHYANRALEHLTMLYTTFKALGVSATEEEDALNALNTPTVMKPSILLRFSHSNPALAGLSIATYLKTVLRKLAFYDRISFDKLSASYSPLG